MGQFGGLEAGKRGLYELRRVDVVIRRVQLRLQGHVELVAGVYELGFGGGALFELLPQGTERGGAREGGGELGEGGRLGPPLVLGRDSVVGRDVADAHLGQVVDDGQGHGAAYVEVVRGEGDDEPGDAPAVGCDGLGVGDADAQPAGPWQGLEAQGFEQSGAHGATVPGIIWAGLVQRLLPITVAIVLTVALAACGSERRQTVVGAGPGGGGEAVEGGEGEAPGGAGADDDDLAGEGEAGPGGGEGEGEGEGPDGGEAVDGGEGEGEGEGGDPPDGGEGEGEVDPPQPVECGTALGVGELPEGLTELAWDDGGPSTSITEQEGWIVGGQDLGVAPLNQSVRFDLEHPARIHAIRVRYQHLPEDEAAPLQIGLHPDFGQNGFDFWEHDTLWSGNLCREDVAAGQWTEFRLDPPVEVPHPLPIWVSHRRQQGGADWAFDVSLTDGCDNPPWCCNTYMECHSANNLPELIEFVDQGQQHYFWSGLALAFWYDYMVRLVVEYDVDEADKIFTNLDDIEPGGRQAWEDVDGDGLEDLLLGGTRLLRNAGEGRFEDISAEALPEGLAGGGGVFGDYDNDGCPDLFVYIEDPGRGDTLLHNVCDGSGHFVDVTEDAGLEDRQRYNECRNDDGARRAAPTSSAAWVDIDGDGLLDLYQGNEVCWDAGGFYADKVWHNDGDGFFEEWTGEQGFLGEEDDDDKLGARGVNPADFDEDGDVDIFVNNYHLHRNLLYVNSAADDPDADDLVAEQGEARGVAGELLPPEFGPIYGHSVGASWGDIDGDGDFDLIIASLAHPRFYDFSDKSQVLIQDADGHFADAQGDWSYPWGDTGIRYQEGHFVPVLFDADQDGALDLSISTAYQGRVTDFYWGVGDGTFELDSYHAGITEEYGGCMATADLDNDGDVDLASAGGVWTNDLPADRKGHWLQVRLVGGPLSNRMAIGATVRVAPAGGGPTQRRLVPGGTGYGCQDSHTLHFGLGEADSVTEISVDFPGAGTVEFGGPFEADQRLWLTEGGEIHEGWAPPAD